VVKINTHISAEIEKIKILFKIKNICLFLAVKNSLEQEQIIVVYVTRLVN
jgi:hypothetical protein